MDRDTAIEIVPFTAERLPLVRDFTERYWARPTSEAFFTWRYLEAHSFSHMLLAAQGDRCLGVLYGLLKSYVLNGQPAPCLEIFDWHALPGLKGSGVGLRLIKAMMRRPERLMGIGGTKDVRAVLPKLGWQRIGTARKFELPLAGERIAAALERRVMVPRALTTRPLDLLANVWFRPRTRAAPGGGAVEVAAMIDEETEGLYRGASHYYSLVQQPTRPLLAWLTRSPYTSGAFFFVRFRLEDRLAGWTLFRIYATAQGREAALVEAFAREPTRDLYTWMVSETLAMTMGFKPAVVRARASCALLQAALRANRFRESADEVPIHTWPANVAEPIGPLSVTLNHSDEPIRPYLSNGDLRAPGTEPLDADRTESSEQKAI